jgi:hypothetical protein
LYINAACSNSTTEFEDVESDGFVESLPISQIYNSPPHIPHAERNNEHWENFVRRAEERGKWKRINDNDAQSLERRQIWEIGCKVR